jgi:hypothetical protein
LWNDEHVAGNVFGPVLVSRRLAQRLDGLDRLPGVQCWWLTSWSAEMRAGMTGFPGAGWPVIAEPDTFAAHDRGWWKLTAVEAWLDQHPEIGSVAWCDDHIRGGRPTAIRRRLNALGMPEALLIAPNTAVGLTPADLGKLERWAAAPAAATGQLPAAAPA